MTNTTHEALKQALTRLRNECDLEGLRTRAGFDCWLNMADEALAAANAAQDGEQEKRIAELEAENAALSAQNVRFADDIVRLDAQLSTARAEGFEQAKEMAAKVCDYWQQEYAGRNSTAISARIRALQCPGQSANAAEAEMAQKGQTTRKAFICKSCEGVYADEPVTQCDCMPDKDEFIEGIISYPAALPAPMDAQPIEWNAAIDAAKKICEGLATLYPREDVGFDKGYSMAASRAAKEIGALKRAQPVAGVVDVRQAFEKWMHTEGWSKHLAKGGHGEYLDDEVSRMWDGWDACSALSTNQVDAQPTDSDRYNAGFVAGQRYAEKHLSQPIKTERNSAGETPTEHAHRWATELAVSMAKKHFPEVPQWQPLPDLLGVISQIDNMTTGLVRATAASGAVPEWMDIETAPKGGGAELVTDPKWVDPPKVLLLFQGGNASIGYWDWYYAEGGRGFEGGTAWIEPVSGERLDLRYGAPTNWMPLRPAPNSEKPKDAFPPDWNE